MKLTLQAPEWVSYEIALRASHISTRRSLAPGTSLIVGPVPEVWFPDSQLTQLYTTGYPAATILAWQTRREEEEL